MLSKVNCEKGTGESSQKKLGEKLGENRRRIIRMMEQDPSVTTFDLAAGIGISQTAIENNITWLRLHGYIRRVGPKKGGRWEVVEG
ncbi:MAG: winged helix-turn-helix transcriptional regulator [Kiritimatiellae bacterium]|nr:winged helix-turn-helix transcriptional regulator [Kiritimatiellia bacterium]